MRKYPMAEQRTYYPQPHELATDPRFAAVVAPVYVVPLLQELANHSAWTYLHSIGTGLVVADMLPCLDVPLEDHSVVETAALVHDVGKIVVPTMVLDKNGRPTDEEWAQIQEHPRAGFDLVIEHDAKVAEIIVGHHEHQGDRSYPRSRVRPDSDLLTVRYQQVVAAADTVDSLINARSYHPGWKPDRVWEELGRKFGTVFDASVLDRAVESGVRHKRLPKATL